ncbi:hypothetical protein Fmac_009344 [Flemingia macrophylla]|uniref:Myb-like domain-containing protein n=1 Tax=Flemingia macrophylla TaxID=520843 RepID=A0ABD1MZZ5_9FABA
MDLFAADHFPVPDHVAPFPDSGELVFAADLLSNRHNPQKLRPIRSLPPPLPPHDPIASGSGHAPLHESRSSLDAEDEDEEDDNSSTSTEALGSRKRRRRKTDQKLEDLVKNLVNKVLEKQEQMHKQLVEMIENKERERIKREEAWKHEEMERIRKDEEARAQERSRNLALISFIQNLLGREIQIPQPVEEAFGKREDDEVDVNAQRDLNNDPSNNRWPDVEVQALITVRTSLEHKIRLMGFKGSIWEEISETMHGMGYNRSAKKCKEKWENINKYYKRTVGSGKKRRLNSKTCPYFDELDILYRNGLLSIGNTSSNTSDVPQIEEKE